MKQLFLAGLLLAAPAQAFACKGLSAEACAELDRREAIMKQDLDMTMRQGNEMLRQRDADYTNRRLDDIEWNTRRRY